MNVLVLGLGQPHRGDDAAGLSVLGALRETPGIDARPGAADAPALLAQIEGAPFAILVDCARGGRPGDILCLDADAAIRAQAGRSSSHGHALADALALGQALNCLPPRLSVIAVCGERFGIGEAMSPAVTAALPGLAARILQEAACTKPA